MRATWYVLEDGSTVDPSEVSTNETGRLAHANGLVAMRSVDCPRTRGVDIGEDGKQLVAGNADEPKPAKAAEPEKVPAPVAPATEVPPVKTSDMKPEAEPAPARQPAYKRRGR